MALAFHQGFPEARAKCPRHPAEATARTVAPRPLGVLAPFPLCYGKDGVFRITHPVPVAAAMILTLIGYRATGKTTLAGLLAERLGWDWIDADVEIERRAGKSIACIFAEDGEPAFRDLEAQVIADLCRRDRLVLAAGGGAPCGPKAARRCARRGKWCG